MLQPMGIRTQRGRHHHQDQHAQVTHSSFWRMGLKLSVLGGRAQHPISPQPGSAPCRPQSVMSHPTDDKRRHRGGEWSCRGMGICARQ